MNSCCKVTTLDEHEVIRLSSTASAFERDVLTLRSKVYGRPVSECRDAFDDYSDHYVLYTQGVPHYASRATRASEGPLECEAFYPQQIISRFRDCLCSNGRLLRNPDLPGGPEQALRFYAAAWRDLIARGIRVDIGNATRKLLPYHNANGYLLLQVPAFRHPVFNTESYTVVLTADPENPGHLPASFPRHIDRIVRFSDLDVPLAPSPDVLSRVA